MSLRTFKPEDAVTCAKMLLENQEFLGNLYTSEELVKNSEYVSYLVIEEGEEAVAIGGLQDLSNGIGMITTLCVDTKHQGKSYGTQLLQALKQLAKEKGFRKLLSLVHEKNKSMMILSLKEDFIPEGILQRHFRDGKSSVVYFSYFM